MSSDKATHDRIVAALSSDPAYGYTSPAEIVHQVDAWTALPDASPGDVNARWRCLVVDARSEKALDARCAPGYPALAPWPVLYVDVQSSSASVFTPERAPVDAATGPSRRPYAADEELTWDERLLGVPFRTSPDDPTFGARLRTRIALLPADVRSERLFAAVTVAADGRVPEHAQATPGCARCGRPALRAPIPRTGTKGDPLLRLLLRPEWYLSGAGHAVHKSDDVDTARRSSPKPNALDRAADEETRQKTTVESRRRRLQHALRNGGLVPPSELLHVALILRISALAAAYGLGVAPVERMLGFGERTTRARPARSTLHRIATDLTGSSMGDLLHVDWPDISEVARLALVRRPGVGADARFVFTPRGADDFDAVSAWDPLELLRPRRRSDTPDQPGRDHPGPQLEREPDPRPSAATGQLDTSATARPDIAPHDAAGHADRFLAALAAARAHAAGDALLSANIEPRTMPKRDPIGARNGRCVWCGAPFAPLRSRRSPRRKNG